MKAATREGLAGIIASYSEIGSYHTVHIDLPPSEGATNCVPSKAVEADVADAATELWSVSMPAKPALRHRTRSVVVI